MEEFEHFRLRIPKGTKDWIKASANQNRRSLNAEIVFCLERYRAWAEDKKSADGTTFQVSAAYGPNFWPHDNVAAPKLERQTSE